MRKTILVAKTAGHMVEAVGYLINVAVRNHMGRVADRLGQARAELMVVAANDDAKIVERAPAVLRESGSPCGNDDDLGL